MPRLAAHSGNHLFLLYNFLIKLFAKSFFFGFLIEILPLLPLILPSNDGDPNLSRVRLQL